METKNILLAIVVFVLILQFSGKTDFLGATEGETSSWDSMLDGLIDTVQTLINSIFDLMKDNALLSVAIIGALILMFTSKGKF